jgi:hypothetical protein
MPQKTTYYAVVDDFSSREEPAGVLRRIEDDEGESDEAFTQNLAWKRSSTLYAAERGNLDNKLYEITEDEAERIVERIRQTVTGQAQK